MAVAAVHKVLGGAELGMLTAISSVHLDRSVKGDLLVGCSEF